MTETPLTTFSQTPPKAALQKGAKATTSAQSASRSALSSEGSDAAASKACSEAHVKGSKEREVHVVGAGLAGSECALQLAALGWSVVLYEMRGETMTPAHKTSDFAELVCSNSFGSVASASAPGELKWEAEALGSRILAAAIEARVPAGQALSVDRARFAQALSREIKQNPLIRVVNKAVLSIDEISRPCVIATGPLTHGALAESLRAHFGDEFLYFFDAIAPIIDADSIDQTVAWRADRWNKGTKDYLNCPLTKPQYFSFLDAVRAAKKIEPKDFEKETPYFDGCMPIEAMIERGPLTLRFGPLSPKGLPDPRTGAEPYAAAQLRQENRDGTAFNMVGFQTKMAYADQKEVFRTIPGLEKAEFLKLGAIHRNLYVHSPKRLGRDLSSKRDPLLFFAGQITGVEGYFESTCIGLLVARFVDQKMTGEIYSAPPRASAMGSLLDALTDEYRYRFQPTNINFSLMPPIEGHIEKMTKRTMQISNARSAFLRWMHENGESPPLESGVDALSEKLRQATATNLAEADLRNSVKSVRPSFDCHRLS